jgi:hypothetical protein
MAALNAVWQYGAMTKPKWDLPENGESRFLLLSHDSIFLTRGLMEVSTHSH